MRKHTRPGNWAGPLALAALASLACGTVYRLAGLEEAPTPAAPLPSATPRPAPRRTAQPTRTPDAAASPIPTLSADFASLDPFRPNLRPEFAGDLDRLPDATRYLIDVVVSFDGQASAFLAGQVRLRYTNQQDFPLPEIYLMLWPNEGNQYLGRLDLGEVQVDGRPVEPELERGGIAARLPLAAPLPPGGQVEISAGFSAEAYDGINAEAPARFGLTNGILMAPTFYPLVPRLVDGAWQTQPAPPGGDTTNSDSAFYLWRVTAPDDLAVIGSGSVIQTERAAGRQSLTLAAGPMRDLALVVGPLEHTRREQDGVTVNAYMLEENAEFTGDLLEFTTGQLRVLQALIGPYPFTELDVVDAPGAFGGIEYPGLVFIGVVGASVDFQEATVHEVGHQWFYSLIGGDQLLEPWLDESAASYTQVLYREEVQGRGSAEGLLDYYRQSVADAPDPDLPIGLPVGDYPSLADYVCIIYQKGALFFHALRQELGDETFFAFLQDYYQTHRYGFASTVDFQAGAETACACDLDALFDLWVYKGGAVDLR